MTDLGVRCYGDLARHYTEGVDYAVHVAPRERSGVAILAPHGGRIEGRTSEIARLIAGEDYGLYLFEGLRTTGDNFDCLHLASSQFDEPRALELISNCRTVLTVHGYAASGADVLLGGLDERLKRKVAQALAMNGFSCLTEGHRFPGSHPDNICNRGQSGEGVQLELSEDVRKTGDWQRLANAVRTVLADGSRSAVDPPIIFYDRRGVVVSPDARSIIKPRRGVFALVVAVNDHAVMLAAEACAPDVPELPGGGIEAGETLDEATQREWAEEVGIPFNAEGPFQGFQQVRGFYADDRHEFWIYDQTFRLYHSFERVKIGQKWRSPEGGTAGWEAIASLPSLSINRAHWCAIPTLLSSFARM